MVVTGAEIKIGVDILSRIFKSFKGVLETRKEKDILSKIYKELLLGDQGDLDKVEAMLLQVEKLGSSSSDFVKAKVYFSKARAGVMTAPKKPASKKVVKSKAMTASKKPAGKRKRV